jgi:hypothetical protein
MDAEAWQRLNATADSGDLGAAAQILVEARGDLDFYSIAMGALAAASTYGHREGYHAAMRQLIQSMPGLLEYRQ